MAIESLPTARKEPCTYDAGSDSVDPTLLLDHERIIILGYFAACAHAKKLLEAARKGRDTSKLGEVFTALSVAEAWLIDNGYRTYLPNSVRVSVWVTWSDLVLYDLVNVRREGERVVRYCDRFRRHVERLIAARAAE